MHTPKQQGHPGPSPLEFTSWDHMPWVTNMELQELLFVLLGVGLDLIQFFG
jgi:hypothetical protein